MEKKIRLGIVGIGNIGTTHASNITSGKCPDFEITAIADNNAERLLWAKEQFGPGVGYFSTCEEMLDSGLVEACIVSVPHYDHPTYAVECIKRGIHVMVEKPAGVYTKQVRLMNEEAQKHPEVVFGMMFNQRTNELYRKLRQMVRSGEFGSLRRSNWIITEWYRPQAYYNSGGWRATWAGEGGGVLLNQCPHQLDLWQWICGMPKKVHAHVHYGKWHDIEVEDDVTAYVEYENGATGVFIATTGDGKGSNRLEIQMDKAKLVVENGVLTIEEFHMSEPEFSAANTEVFGQLKSEIREVRMDGASTQHAGVLNAWADAILRGGELVADGAEGINGLMISNAMHLSAFLGKEVELPIDEDLYYEELMKRVATSKRKAVTKTVFADTFNTYGDNQKQIEEHYKLR